MPQNIFNLYSASIFADHPIALWNLDDDFSFLSVVGASPIWTISGGTSSSAQAIKKKPGETVGVAEAEISVSSFTGSSSAMVMKAQSFNAKTDIDITKNTVCIGTFIYSDNDNIEKLHIGFEYTDPITSQINKVYKEYTSFQSESWLKAQYTKDIIDDIDGLYGNGINFYPYIEILFKNTAINKTISLNNFSVGQWSEEYNSETVGSVAVPITQVSGSNVFITAIGGSYSASPQIFKSFEIDTYSLDDSDNGYYLVENNKMLAVNTKLPMVFGSGNITEIYPSNYGNPSIIIPGKGFFNEDGKYKELTAEFWLKINPDIGTDFRIFGPVTSEDGLYVKNGFLKLKVGPYEKSYFIGKWYRPMLIDITYSQTFVSVMINGETVIQISLNIKDVAFPSTKVFETDWLGFYSHEFITKFEIDCIAIYPYMISEQVAKKKFVLAQGVGKSDEIVKRFGGTLTNVDFSFANYSNNVSYPNSVPWASGFYSNVDANSRFISLPSYDKPSINYIGDDLFIFSAPRFQRTWAGIQETSLWERWTQGIWQALALAREAEPLYDNFFTQSNIDPIKHFTFRPSTLYKNLYGSINFKSLNVITDPVASVLGIFAINSTELQSAINDVNINELTLIHFKNNATGDIFKIYINPTTSQIVYQFNSTILKTVNITVSSVDTRFAVGIDVENISKNYSIIRNFFFNPQNITFSVGGYERNTFTGRIYRVTLNNRFFTLKDFSLIYESDGTINHTSATTALSTWLLGYIGNYTLMFKQTNASMIMDVGSAGYWEDSIPLSSFATFVKDANGNTTKYSLDLMQFNIDSPSPSYSSTNVSVQSKINIDTYVTLKKYEDVGLINYLNYTNTKELSTERVIDFEDNSIDVDNTKFRVIDNSIIFAPKQIINFEDSYLTVHLEIKSDATSTEPLRVNRMSFSSLAYDEIGMYELGSITGNKMYPFVRSGYSYSNKIKNPFIFYRESMPYLYLTADSGVFSLPYNSVDSSSTSFNRGVSIPINLSKLPQYSLYGFHMWMNFNGHYEFSNTKKIMTMFLKNGDNINFYLVPENDKKRATIQAKLSTVVGETTYTNVSFYQNGILVDNQYIRPLAWSMITFSFNQPLDYSNFIGQIEMHPGIIFNNFAVYESSIEGKVDDIFESHLGLSNIVAQDESLLYINSDDADLYTDFQWSFFSGKPV